MTEVGQGAMPASALAVVDVKSSWVSEVLALVDAEREAGSASVVVKMSMAHKDHHFFQVVKTNLRKRLVQNDDGRRSHTIAVASLRPETRSEGSLLFGARPAEDIMQADLYELLRLGVRPVMHQCVVWEAAAVAQPVLQVPSSGASSSRMMSIEFHGVRGSAAAMEPSARPEPLKPSARGRPSKWDATVQRLLASPILGRCMQPAWAIVEAAHGSKVVDMEGATVAGVDVETVQNLLECGVLEARQLEDKDT